MNHRPSKFDYENNNYIYKFIYLLCISYQGYRPS